MFKRKQTGRGCSKVLNPREAAAVLKSAAKTNAGNVGAREAGAKNVSQNYGAAKDPSPPEVKRVDVKWHSLERRLCVINR